MATKADKKQAAVTALTRASEDQREAIAAREQTVRNLQWSGKLTKSEKLVLYHATKAYGLDPALREILVLGGNMYCTVSGMVRVAERSGNYAGLSYEQLDSEPGEVRYRATVRKLVQGQLCSFEGLGRAEESKLNKVTKDFAEEMAQTRALGRALRRAWPISMPAFEELPQQERWGAEAVPAALLEEIEMELDGATEKPISGGAAQVDPETGEVSEEEYVNQGPRERDPGEEG